MHLQENTLFDLGGGQSHTKYDLWVKVTQNFAQYRPHLMTYMYAPAKFEVA